MKKETHEARNSQNHGGTHGDQPATIWQKFGMALLILYVISLVILVLSEEWYGVLPISWPW